MIGGIQHHDNAFSGVSAEVFQKIPLWGRCEDMVLIRVSNSRTLENAADSAQISGASDDARSEGDGGQQPELDAVYEAEEPRGNQGLCLVISLA